MIRWSTYPLLRPGVLFITGILIASWVSISDTYFAVLAVFTTTLLVFLSFLEYSRKHLQLRSVGIWTLYVLLGIWCMEVHSIKRDNSHYANFIHGKEHVVRLEFLEDVHTTTSSKAMATLHSINGQATRGRIMVYFDKKDQASYRHGSIVEGIGTIKEIRKNTNPDVFDYKKYLSRKNIGHSCRIHTGRHTIIHEDNLPFFVGQARTFRAWAMNRLEELVPNFDQRAIASAMILGHKKDISEDLYNAYSETGAIHVLAVSGLHVGVIYMIFSFFFRFFKNKSTWVKGVKVISLLGIVWMYCLVTGAVPSVVRASIMFSFMIIGKEVFEKANIYNILMASAIFILLYDPQLLFQVSFQFSYLALISIVFFQPLIMAYLYSPWKILDKVTGLIVVSIAAQILVFPATVYYFHKFPIYFVLSGLVAVPMAFLVLTSGLAAIILGNIPLLGTVCAIILNGSLTLFKYAITYIHRLPYASIKGLWFEPTDLISIYLVLILAMFAIYSKQKWTYGIPILSTILLGLGYSSYLDYSKKASVSLIVYDMGYQGSMFDVKERDYVYTYKSKQLAQKSIDYNTQNYRLRHGVKSIIPLESNKGFFHIDSTVVQYVQGEEKSTYTADTELLLLLNKARLYPDTYKDTAGLKTVVADASIAPWIRKKWKTYCLNNGIRFHSVADSGAYVQAF